MKNIDTSQKGLSDSFNEARIIPDTIRNPPAEFLEVVFPTSSFANLGNELKPSVSQDRPNIKWNSCAADDLYTIVMIDLDPSSCKLILHWLEVNAQKNGKLSGDLGIAYAGPKPRQPNGLHRYVHLVFKQSERIDPSDPLINNPSRRDYPFQTLLEKYNLGDPVAGNYFLAQFEEPAATNL